MRCYTLPADPVNRIPEAHFEQGSFLSYGNYSFENEDGTKTLPKHLLRVTAFWSFEDKSGNFEYDLSSPEWGSGFGLGHYTMPMHDKSTGLYRIGHREILQFPGNLDVENRQGLINTCDSLDE